MIIMKRTLISLLMTGSGLALTGGCSSVMTHTGPDQGYYSGTRANIDVLRSDDTSWAMTPLVVLDMPFSAVMDTLLLPYDYSRSGTGDQAASPRERIRRSEQQQAVTTAPALQDPSHL